MNCLRFAVLAVAAAAGLCMPAAATWRVVGPGMAVGEARSGSASLAAECLHDGLVLGLYNLDWMFSNADALDLVVDGQTYRLRQYRAGDRILLSDEDTPSGHHDVSTALLTALKTGSVARLEGPAVSDIDPKMVTFSLIRSEGAISTVERFCR